MWEYTRTSDEDTLKTLGLCGWECYGVTHNFGIIEGIIPPSIIYFLKRRLDK